MRKTCDICRGERKIKLPVRQPAQALYTADAIAPRQFMESCRVYDCPECSKPVVAEADFVKVAKATETYEREYELYPGFLDHLKGHLAFAIARQALQEGLVSVQVSKGPKGSFRDSKVATATVGFVSPAFVETIEQRAAVKAAELLEGAADDAARSISVWGSEYHGDSGPITKEMAMRFVREAFAKRIERINQSAKKD